MVIGLERRLLAAYRQDRVSFKHQELVLNLLNTLKEHHPPTCTESIEVALTARKIANFVHLPSDVALDCGALHDIGKIGIPKELLDKSYSKGADYTPKDHEVMKPHTEIGYSFLMAHGLIIPAWVARTHHLWKKDHPYPEKLPSYPEQLKSHGERLNALNNSRIVSIADQNNALHRNNDMHGNKPLTQRQIRMKLIEGNPDQAYLINELYLKGILS